MKNLGVVVLYYPDDEVWKNVASYAPFLDKLIVWDNTPTACQKGIPAIPTCNPDLFLLLGCGRNVGIGTALNEAVRYGIMNGFTHLLTMDQDSCFGEGMFELYLDTIRAVKDTTIKSFSANTNKAEAGVSTLSEVHISITSGTTYLLSVFKETNLFRDDFFIDAIDTEFCFRLSSHGFRMVRLNHVFMHHALGQVTVTPFLWGKLISPNYSAQRTYYLTRNTLFLTRLYPEYKQAKGQFKTILFWRPITILFVEADKWIKFKAIFKGIYHAYRGKQGEYVIG